MIPNNSTPIKNEILIDIIAKGLLNKDETRIMAYIIRWSWGFDGKSRRQDYTKELTKRQIADDIGMNEGHLNRNINKMIKENKIIKKDDCYQFNEHYKEWKNLTNSQVPDDKILDEKSRKTCQIVKFNLPNSQVILDKKSSLTDLKPLQDKTLPDRKETLKETNKENKETKEVPINLFREEEEKENTLLINNEEKEKKKPNNIEFDFEMWSWHGIDDDIMERWMKIFPGVEVSLELVKMREFFKKHPDHEKVIEDKFKNNYAIYIFNWLERAGRYNNKPVEVGGGEEYG